MGVRGGIGIFEAAGVGRDGKIQRLRHLPRQRHAEQLQQLQNDLAAGGAVRFDELRDR